MILPIEPPAALLDLFQPPLCTRRHWHVFYTSWATHVASALNEVLPPEYFAVPNVQFDFENDVASFGGGDTTDEEPGRAATAAVAYAPPAPTLVVPFVPVRETVEVQVCSSVGGPVLAAAIELVSPANKDRDAHRQAFAAKCQGVLGAGAGLMIVDVVTARRSDLHQLLLARLSSVLTQSDDGDASDAAGSPALYAAAYRPTAVPGDDGATIEVWREPLSVGRPLPTLPLWLKGGPVLRVDLAASYGRTCREQRIA